MKKNVMIDYDQVCMWVIFDASFIFKEGSHVLYTQTRTDERDAIVVWFVWFISYFLETIK
jgi:hypothetical protein